MKIVDLHCDTLDDLMKFELRKEPYGFYKREGHLDIVRMKESGYLLQCFALFVHMEQVESPYKRAKELIEIFQRICAENSSYIAQARNYAEILENQKKGLMSGMLTIEEGGVLEGRLDYLNEFYEAGVRMITLTWNFANEIGFPGVAEKEKLPCCPANWKVFGEYPGLTKRGIEIIEAMEEKGILIDVSHLSDAGFWDVAKIAKNPFVASHSNSRSVCRHTRNLSDEQIRMIAEHGGVIGMNYARDFLEDDMDNVTLDSFVRNIKHMIQVGGEDVIALGSDFDGIITNPVMKDCSVLPSLFEVMQQRGIAPSVIDKLQGKNALRVMKEVLK